LLSLTQHELGDQATFHPKKPTFFYTGSDARVGNYNLDWKLAEKNSDIFYRTDHALAVMLLDRAIKRELPPVLITFDYKAHGARIAALEKHVGSSGWLELSKLTIESFETEEFLVFAARTDDGKLLDGPLCRKLMSLPGTVSDPPVEHSAAANLKVARKAEVQRCAKEVDNRNGRFFDDEVAKLERWSDDLKLGLEREIKDFDQKIKEIRRESQSATALTEKLTFQKDIKAVESSRNRKRRELYDAQDAIDRDRDELIGKIEKQLSMNQRCESLFEFRWSLA
jgi:adenine-specific DNA-methyltransferase